MVDVISFNPYLFKHITSKVELNVKTKDWVTQIMIKFW